MKNGFSDWDIQAVKDHEKYMGFINLMKDIRFSHPDLFLKYANTLNWVKGTLDMHLEDAIVHGENVINEYEEMGIDIFTVYPEMFTT
jgi:hypothetical protein